MAMLRILSGQKQHLCEENKAKLLVWISYMCRRLWSLLRLWLAPSDCLLLPIVFEFVGKQCWSHILLIFFLHEPPCTGVIMSTGRVRHFGISPFRVLNTPMSTTLAQENNAQ